MYYKSSSQDSIQAKEWSDTVGGVGKGVDRVINVPKEEDVGASYDLEQECKWGDASLIDCDVLKVVKSILGEVAKEHAKWIKEAKWDMCAKPQRCR